MCSKFLLNRAPKRAKGALNRAPTVRYTENGDSTFNPTFLILELFKAGDVELNPIDDMDESRKLVLSNRGLRIGQ